MNKKAFTLVELIAVVAILGLIAIIVYPAIGSVIRNSRESAYKDQVDVIVKAAKTWSIDHVNELKDDGSVYRLPVSTLLNDGYITNDEIKDPRNTSKDLSGNVEIKYDTNVKEFTYTYVDNETDDLTINSLALAITNNSKKKAILMANDGIYKGTNPDNYLKFNDKIWRILSNNEDGSIKIISNDSSGAIAWDINGNLEFQNSTINKYLNNNFYNSLNSVSEFKSSNFCLKYNQNKCTENATFTVGLLTVQDYLNASNNLKCQTGSEDECTVGNYLSDFSLKNGPEYTINSTNNSVYAIENGKITTKSSTATLNVRPVLTINEDVKIIGGTGSEENPYLINVV